MVVPQNDKIDAQFRVTEERDSLAGVPTEAGCGELLKEKNPIIFALLCRASINGRTIGLEYGKQLVKEYRE